MMDEIYGYVNSYSHELDSISWKADKNVRSNFSNDDSSSASIPLDLVNNIVASYITSPFLCFYFSKSNNFVFSSDISSLVFQAYHQFQDGV